MPAVVERSHSTSILEAVQKVALYVRVSSIAQAAGDLSIPDQLHQLRARAAFHKWVVVAEYIDSGFTGRNEQRPDYQRMLAHIPQVNR